MRASTSCRGQIIDSEDGGAAFHLFVSPEPYPQALIERYQVAVAVYTSLELASLVSWGLRSRYAPRVSISAVVLFMVVTTESEFWLS